MTRILVNTEALQQLAGDLQRAANEFRGLGNHVKSVYGRMDWEARQRVGMTGNVNAASSSAEAIGGQLEELGHWLANKMQTFAESDREGAASLGGIAYRSDMPTPFVSGPTLGDIRQGDIGDCGLVAALGAIAYTQPDVIKRAIKENADGTYTVTLYSPDDGKAHDIVVSGEFNADSEHPDRLKGASSPDGNEIWVSLIEKAIVKAKTGGTAIGDYQQIRALKSNEVMTMLMGHPAEQIRGWSYYGTPLPIHSSESFSTTISDALASHRPITVGIQGNPITDMATSIDNLGTKTSEWVRSLIPIGDTGLLHNHYFVITGVQGNEVTLYNPWGSGVGGDPADFVVSVDELRRHTEVLDIGDTPHPAVDSPLPGISGPSIA